MRINLITSGIILIVFGMLLLFAGVLTQSLGSAVGSKSEVKGGAVILIGPIPMCLAQMQSLQRQSRYWRSF